MEHDRPLFWLRAEIKTPPLSEHARREAGFLLRMVQDGEKLSMPQSRPMPDIGKRCHELRIRDADNTWRIVYRIDDDAIVVAHVFAKKTGAMPQKVIKTCRSRLAEYDAV